MNTTDPRDLTWNELRDELSGHRSRIWEWLRTFGPATTSQIAERMDITLFSVRPRVCELAQLGFVECIDRDGREGVYQAVTLAARQARHEEDLREMTSQLPLKLPEPAIHPDCNS
jgi:predicted ArsR family transcriptional regulator